MCYQISVSIFSGHRRVRVGNRDSGYTVSFDVRLIQERCYIYAGNDAAVPNTVGYHNVAFAYGDPNESTEQKTNDADLVFRPAFPVPESLIQNPWEDIDQLVIHNGSKSSKQAMKLIMKTLICCVLAYSKLLLPNWSNQQVK
ncbi:PREDICTED: uncharacterized protein LOC101309890 [Fragaria vesca subsp. vesca]|uniref:uncharacterized protein LOC101309890 n=1 Tax=Fragaria vesca subsp. vesca TaxID=101020 RepID=UPI0002C357D7|nr:PREDICTED: uncharacterized protein LOC101309890 [Fragaria vesca subsp. vesca]